MGEVVLLLKTEWRVHFWLGVLAVVISLYFALSANEPSLFGRSGALMTITGAFMTYRAFFRGREDEYLRDTGHADRRAFTRWNALTSKGEARMEDRKAFRWGIISFVIGTLIWSYGISCFRSKCRPRLWMLARKSSALRLKVRFRKTQRLPSHRLLKLRHPLPRHRKHLFPSHWQDN